MKTLCEFVCVPHFGVTIKRGDIIDINCIKGESTKDLLVTHISTCNDKCSVCAAPVILHGSEYDFNAGHGFCLTTDSVKNVVIKSPPIKEETIKEVITNELTAQEIFDYIEEHQLEWIKENTCTYRCNISSNFHVCIIASDGYVPRITLDLYENKGLIKSFVEDYKVIKVKTAQIEKTITDKATKKFKELIRTWRG